MSKTATSEVNEAKARNIEVWFSFDSINHHISLAKPKVKPGDVQEYWDVWFKNYRLELDLNEPDQAAINKALKQHPRHGSSFARIVNTQSEGEKGKQWANKIDYLLAPKHHERRGLEKVSAMFLPIEMEEAGIDVRDLDSHRDKLSRLAVGTRSQKDVNED